MAVLQPATKTTNRKHSMNTQSLKATSAGHHPATRDGGRMTPAIMIFRDHQNNGLFTFAGDKRQRGRALRRARALAARA
jgi:hypothetical protein